MMNDMMVKMGEMKMDDIFVRKWWGHVGTMRDN